MNTTVVAWNPFSPVDARLTVGYRRVAPRSVDNGVLDSWTPPIAPVREEPCLPDPASQFPRTGRNEWPRLTSRSSPSSQRSRTVSETQQHRALGEDWCVQAIQGSFGHVRSAKGCMHGSHVILIMRE